MCLVRDHHFLCYKDNTKDLLMFEKCFQLTISTTITDPGRCPVDLSYIESCLNEIYYKERLTYNILWLYYDNNNRLQKLHLNIFEEEYKLIQLVFSLIRKKDTYKFIYTIYICRFRLHIYKYNLLGGNSRHIINLVFIIYIYYIIV